MENSREFSPGFFLLLLFAWGPLELFPSAKSEKQTLENHSQGPRFFARKKVAEQPLTMVPGLF